MKKLIVLIVLALLVLPTASLSPVGADGPKGEYYRVRTTTLEDGTVLAASLISGPPTPPPGALRSTVARLPEASIAAGVNILSDVPAFNWSFGCSATSAAMIAGYYDRTEYPYMYAGPTNGGVMPLDNSAWPYWTDSGGDTRAQCPLSATHDGLDGRTTKGHVDDYWIAYGNAGPDPFKDNWTEHTYGDCTGDFMKTNQSEYGNVDGGTTFYNYTDGSRLYWDAMISHGIEDIDGGYGLKLFYESRGYTVVEMYNQYILSWASSTQGFTYDQYKAEIDAGRPVMIHVQGHTMVGIGYDDATDLMYIHDTWDYNVHTMTWGASYSGMAHYGVTIVQLAATGSPPAAPTGLAATAAGMDQIDLTWTDNASDETGFRIERSSGGSAWALIDSVGADTTGYADTGLAAGTTYTYRLYAFNAGGDSAYSNEDSATTATDTTPPAPPANLSATPGDGVVDLAWSANTEPDLDGYSVYRSTNSGGPYTLLTTSLLTSTSYSDGAVSNGTTYYYVVTATDLSGNESADSTEAPATPQWQGDVDVASADYATTYGSLSGTYLATQAQDGVHQSITEQHSGGKPSKRHDRLEHIWTFDVTSGNHVFNLDAYHADSGGDDLGFDFFWAPGLSGPWSHLLYLSDKTENDSYRTAEMGDVSGTIYVRVVDDNRVSNPYYYDTLHVDHMFIDGGAPPTEPPDPASSPDPADGVTGVSSTPTLTWSPGAGADSHDVYFGLSPIFSAPDFKGNQPGTSFTPDDLALNTTYYWRIDEVNDVGTTEGYVWSFATRSSAGATTMHVGSIVVDIVRSNPPLSSGRATVVVVDDLGDLVVSADVEGSFTFTTSLVESQSATTLNGGAAELTTNAAIKKPSFTFCVDDISIIDPPLTYAPDDNVVTCASYP